MSRKGNCRDNAAMGFFFAKMKVESIYAEQPRNMEEAYAGVFKSIDLFYNNIRRRSAIDYQSPKKNEQIYYAQCA